MMFQVGHTLILQTMKDMNDGIDDENHEQTNVSNEDVSNKDAQDSQVSQMDVSAGSNTVPSNEDQTDNVDPQEQTHEQSNDETNDEALDLTVNDDGYDSDVQITGVSIPDKPNPTIAGRVH